MYKSVNFIFEKWIRLDVNIYHLFLVIMLKKHPYRIDILQIWMMYDV